jgi:ubiquinone/menaquinone biosynthesis C-methylase UbiE
MTIFKKNIGPSTEHVEKIFKVWSGFYDHPLPQKLFYGRIHNILLKALKDLKPISILDAGCGTGELFTKIAKQWPAAKLVGLDLSADMLKVAADKTYLNDDVSFIEASVYDIPSPDEEFDLITNNISSHFYLEFEDALREFARVLKPGGTLAMASLTNGAVGVFPGPFKKELPMAEMRFRGTSFQKKELQRCGFKVSRVIRLPLNARLFIATKC